MLDFILNLLADIAEIFIDLWIDKRIGRKGTKNELEVKYTRKHN